MLAGEFVWEAIGLRARPLSCWEVREAAPCFGGGELPHKRGEKATDQHHHHLHHQLYVAMIVAGVAKS